MTMIQHLNIAALLSGMALCVACGNQSGKDLKDAGLQSSAVELCDTVSSPVLELPAIPATISEPEDKAGFIAIHFWDNLDFSDTSKSLRMPFMEQNFVEYLSIFPAVMSADRLTAFKSLMERASVSPETRALVIELGEKYLNQPDSPMKNAEYYSDFRKAAGI